jgi:ribose transport system substrate-binding protein
MIKASASKRLLIGLATLAVGLAACSTAATPAPASGGAGSPGASTAGKQFTIGYSNGGGVGNGFREEQVCTAKAQAKASGQVSNLTVIHRNTDAAGQLADIRTLIAKNVNAIVFNPNDPAALNPALAEAKAANIPTVSVDAFVTDPNTWNLYNNQVKYAQLGAEWLFKQMGGKGTVWYTRGLAGHPADSDRDIGFQNALKEFPDIVVQNPGGTFTGWDPAVATQITNDEISSGAYDQIQGIWASGMGAQIVDAIKAAGKPFVPIADADIGQFVQDLLNPTGYPGLVGAAVRILTKVLLPAPLAPMSA